MRLSALSTAAVVALGAFAVGCGSDNGGSQASSGAKTATTVDVSETEFKLTPANPEVKETGVVQFKVKNDGKIVHALEVEGPSGEVKTEAIQPGKSATLKANLSKAGSYEWYCPIDGHKKDGMKGEISVAGGGSSSSDDNQKKDAKKGKSSYGY